MVTLLQFWFYISQFREKKKSELWDKKSQFSYFFFHDGKQAFTFMCCWLNEELGLTPRPSRFKTVHVCCIYLVWIRCTLWTGYIKIIMRLGDAGFAVRLGRLRKLRGTDCSLKRPRDPGLDGISLVQSAVCATWDWCSAACISRSGGTGRRHGTSSRPCVRSQLTNSGSPPYPPEAHSQCDAPSQLWHRQQPRSARDQERVKQLGNE